jgi:asparagine synthase (glutamine-hydrolysing)
MCGIVLTIGANAESKTYKALDTLKHRGNDDISVFPINDNISLGFRRFAINDLSEKGKQPFIYRNFIGAFNGEVYNHKELKKKYNIQTISKSDTEILLPLYEKFGDNFYDLIDGMFVGIIFNILTNEIIVIKDIIAKKPLFLVNTEENIFFVSELKAIKENVIHFTNIQSGISKFKLNGDFIENKFLSKKLLLSDFQDKTVLYNLLQNAVIKRIPDEKIGIFLSGGLDSSIISYLALQKTKNILFYSLIDRNSDDYSHILEIVRFLNIDKNQIKFIEIPKREEIEYFIEKVVYYSESYNPSIISNGIGTYILSKEAKKDGLKIILSGEGSDEVFCGYKSFFKNETFKENWKELRNEFIENIYFTEVRRLDLCSMAHTIEARSPFLDKNIVAFANGLDENSFFQDNTGKKILRELFVDKLPADILNRKKVSFDVGSGIRGLVVDFLTKHNSSEKENLKNIWNNFFGVYYDKLCDNEYFHSYPSFNDVIAKRGRK